MTTPLTTLEQSQERLTQPLTAPLPKPMADYLENLNNVIKPYLLAQGFIMTAITAREALAMLTFTYVTTAPTMAKTIDTWTATPANFRGYRVPLRIFVPQAIGLTTDKLTQVPVMMYFHGGGGMAGSVSVYDKIYKKMAEATGSVVVAPEYRLAPENLYPAGIDDAHTVLQYLEATLNQHGLSCGGECTVAGDSAGGAITATLIQDWLANKINTNIRITRQVLIYAGLDYTLSQPSMQENAVGYLLETTRVAWYYDHYFTRHDDRELASPFWTDLQALAFHTPFELPKTLHLTAGYCPLRDEDIGYHEQMLKAGFHSEWYHFDNMIHAFVNMEDLCKEECATLYQLMGDFMKAEK